MAYFDPITKIYHGKEVPQIYHPEASLGQVLLFNFIKVPNKVIQVCDEDGIELTCSRISEMMKNIAKNLFYLGARPGDVAGLFATNTTFVAPAIFGCYLYGLPLSPIDKSFDISQIVEIYKETKPKLIFCDHDLTERLIKALVILESDARIVTLTDKINGFLHISDLISACDAPVQS
jgi:long-subunit acyl-CoA synthetase (AMP-forming)